MARVKKSKARLDREQRMCIIANGRRKSGMTLSLINGEQR